MKSIFEKKECEDIINRINNLKSDSKNLWGKMTVNQMLCHASDQIRDILGVRNTEALTSPEMQQQIKTMLLVEDEWGHNAPTFPPYLQDEGGGGTKPINLEQDKKMLIDLVNKSANSTADSSYHPHAGLGVLNRDEVGKFVWKHTDHHLRSFGV